MFSFLQIKHHFLQQFSYCNFFLMYHSFSLVIYKIEYYLISSNCFNPLKYILYTIKLFHSLYKPSDHESLLGKKRWKRQSDYNDLVDWEWKKILNWVPCLHTMAKHGQWLYIHTQMLQKQTPWWHPTSQPFSVGRCIILHCFFQVFSGCCIFKVIGVI